MASVNVLIQKKSMNLIKKFKEEGKYCITWTVNNKKYMRDLIELGVDAIITDNPKKLMKVIKEKQKWIIW